MSDEEKLAALNERNRAHKAIWDFVYGQSRGSVTAEGLSQFIEEDRKRDYEQVDA